MANYYVVIRNNGTGSPWLLDLRPKSLADCTRAVAWQKIGQGQFDSYDICKYDSKRRLFIGVDGTEYTITSQRPYTEKAWQAALARDFT